MCDQDHFEDDRREYEALGLVTRRQFGVLVGAGIAMMLPQVANAVAVTESDVTVTTPDGTCRLLLRAPGERHRAGRAHLAGHLRPAARVSPDGQAARRVGLFGAGREPVLSHEEGADRRAGRGHSDRRRAMPLAQALNETTQMTDAKAFIGWLDQQPSVAKNRKVGTQGYCMGGPIAFRTAAADARSRRRGRLIPRRRPGDR